MFDIINQKFINLSNLFILLFRRKIMWSFLWWFIWDLFVNWAISASEQTVYKWAYLWCLAFLAALHFFIWYKFYLKIADFFFYKHFSLSKFFTILTMLIVSISIFWVALKSIYLHEICDWFGWIMAKHIHLSGNWGWIDLDN